MSATHRDQKAYLIGSSLRLDQFGLTSIGDGKKIGLTPTELTIMRVFTEEAHFRPGERVNTLTLIDAIYPEKYRPSDPEKTLSAHISGLRNKLPSGILPAYERRLACNVTLTSRVGGVHPRLDFYFQQLRENPAALFFRNDGILEDLWSRNAFDELSGESATVALCFCLASGLKSKELVSALGARFPEETENVLTTALFHPGDAIVRRNAVEALDVFQMSGREALLNRIAILDPDKAIRQTAARILALKYPASLSSLSLQNLKDPTTRDRAVEFLAFLHEEVGDSQFNSPNSPINVQLPWLLKLRIDSKILKDRWERANKAPEIWRWGIVCTLVIEVPVRALLGFFGLTVLQVNRSGLPGFFEAGFHGVVGATVWSAVIGSTVMLSWFGGKRGSLWAPAATICATTLAGFCGGLGLSLADLAAAGRTSLTTIHMLPAATSNLAESFTRTRLAWQMPLYGAAVGLGTGGAALHLLHWLLRRQHLPQEVEYQPINALIASRQLLICSLMTLLPSMLFAVMITHILLATAPIPQTGVGKLVGEAISIGCGGIGLTTGLFGPLWKLKLRVLSGRLLYAQGEADARKVERRTPSVRQPDSE